MHTTIRLVGVVATLGAAACGGGSSEGGGGSGANAGCYESPVADEAFSWPGGAGPERVDILDPGCELPMGGGAVPSEHLVVASSGADAEALCATAEDAASEQVIGFDTATAKPTDPAVPGGSFFVCS